jgi:hypothetical protein
MPTDQKLSALQDSTAIFDSDLVAMVKNMGTAPATVGRPWADLKANVGGGGFNEGFMTNGKLVVTVASNDLIVALKTLAGTDPSAGDKVEVRINGVVHEITAALSVTAADATNWCNAGAAELATKEIDYFAYLGYNATDGVVIGFSRISHANSYDDFSATSTNEKFCKISTITTAAATDYYTVIGRFAATLSAGAGYTWTVPTYTAKNLIQRPIYETRYLSYAPTITGYFGNPTDATYKYKVVGDLVLLGFYEITAGTSNATTKTYTTPFTTENVVNQGYIAPLPAPYNNGAFVAAGSGVLGYNSNSLAFYLSAIGAWTNSGGAKIAAFQFWIKI